MNNSNDCRVVHHTTHDTWEYQVYSPALHKYVGMTTRYSKQAIDAWCNQYDYPVLMAWVTTK